MFKHIEMLNFVTFGYIDNLKKWTIPVSVLYGVTPTPIPILRIIIMLIDIGIIRIRKGLYVNGKKRIVGFNPQDCSSLIIQ